MTIEAELAKWIVTRPAWQQDLFAKLCRGDSIGDEVINEVVVTLISGADISASTLAESDIPGGATSPEAVRLRELRSVDGINALAPDQSLRFSDKGLTVIYGDNGSGKSGYARLLRTAVRARVHGDVLGNVFASSSAVDQHAIFDYAVGDKAGPQEWKWQEPYSHELAQVHYYDDECGDAYISTASEISYRPSALVLLDQLVAACDSVRDVLDEKLRANNEEKATLPVVEGSSAAGQFLQALDSNTSDAEVDVATEGDHRDAELLGNALQAEARLKASDPVKERQRLNGLAADYKTVAIYCSEVELVLAPAGQSSLAVIRSKSLELRAAARIASSKKFDDEPVRGVGTETWRSLWQAAKLFSEAEAYKGSDFPHTGLGERCVLCQQELATEGSERLGHFHKFMQDATETDARDAKKELELTRDKIAAFVTTAAHVSSAVNRIRSANEEDGAALDQWLSNSALVAAATVSWLDDETENATVPRTVPPSPATELRSTASKLAEAANGIDSGSFTDQLQASSLGVKQLQGKIAMTAGKSQICEEICRLKDRAKIEQAKRLTDTSGITRKSSDLTKEYVTRFVRDRFTRETENLRLKSVTLDPKSGRKGTLSHLPTLLNAASKAAVTDVLSEGEKTALGLAGFFTEVDFDSTQSAVVLDDPITSLDHERRSFVAKRVIELAGSRQVIVFTHDISFVGDLSKYAREAGVPVTDRWVSRHNTLTGIVEEKLPWKASDVAARIDRLKVDLGRLRKERQDLDSDAYERRCSDWAGMLSETWERAINTEIVYQVVDRGTQQVKPLKFKILAAITSDDHKNFDEGYSRTSEWARRHDKDPERNFVPPEPDEMQPEIERLDAWFKCVKAYRK